MKIRVCIGDHKWLCTNNFLLSSVFSYLQFWNKMVLFCQQPSSFVPNNFLVYFCRMNKTLPSFSFPTHISKLVAFVTMSIRKVEQPYLIIVYRKPRFFVIVHLILFPYFQDSSIIDLSIIVGIKRCIALWIWSSSYMHSFSLFF